VTQHDEPTFGLYYDFRHVSSDAPGLTDRWRGIVEQITWAESRGFGSVWLSEHHFLPDDYASSTMTLLAAIAMRTERMHLGTNVLVLPVHEPLRLAEEALTVDALSGGRLRLGVGLGYRAPEFPPFGTTMAARRRRFEGALEVLRHAFRGDPVYVAADGSETRVSPRPVRAGGPELWIGALSSPAIERAARLGDGFLCVLPEQMAEYVETRRSLGLDDGRVAIGNQWIVAEDPEREFARIGQHVLYQVNAYAEYGAFGPPELVPRLTDPQQVVDQGHYRLLDAAAAATELRGQIASGPVVDCFGWTLFPGEPLESAAARLEYFAQHVIPAVRGAGDPTAAGSTTTERPGGTAAHVDQLR
jgi:alkanesulfonate monooxygenase SsuD/methylene tetrahydromethanopterin reductase-like flavin-dependent oxidoreductase (luciferase family)